MDWKKALGDLAPVLGSAFGPLGTAGGLAIKQLLGLPVDSSDEDANAFIQTPEGAAKAKQAEYDFKIQLGAQQIQQNAQDAELAKTVNDTMQEESKSEHWLQWAWRPLWGIISAGAFGFVCILCCILAYKAVVEHDSAAMTMIPQFITAITMLFSVPGAILGITAWGRNQLKIAQATA